MNAIDATFERLRGAGRRAFIPFVTAGDPDLETTALVIAELAARGASIIEVGIPYSDPIADGPVVQASYTRALERGVKLGQIFEMVRAVQAAGGRAARSDRLQAVPGPAEASHDEPGRPPLVAMVSYAIVFRHGTERFLDEAREAGFSGAIVPDLPADEADELAARARARDFSLIQLVTPTTTPDRARRIVAACSGFVYYVSLTGITGERDRLAEGLIEQLRRLRGMTELPICVGFGISRPEHVRLLKDAADGVIVGSAIVRRLAEAGEKPREQLVREIGEYAGELMAALE